MADKWEEIEHSDPSSKSENAIPVELICVDATSAAGSSISSNNNSSKSSAAASGKYSESVSLDMRFLIQADTMSSLSKLLQGSTGCRGVCVDCKECMLRITNEFGLLDSKAIPIVFLTIKIA